MSDFKSLNLERAKIEDTIKGVEGFELVQKTEIQNGYQYLLKFDNEDVLFKVFENSDGSTTLTHKIGKRQDLSLRLAQTVKDNCDFGTFPVGAFYLKAIQEEDFKLVIEFLEEKGAVRITPLNIKNGYQVKLKGVQNDILTFNYYPTTSSLSIQGKPYLLFSQAYEIMVELLPFKEVLEQQLKFYSINISSTEILSELDNRIPSASHQLHDKVKAIIAPSLALRKITEFELSDYSCYTFPVLRGLEAVLKQILLPHVIIKSDGNGFKDVFGIDFRNRNTIIKEEYEGKFDSKTEAWLKKAYSFYKSKRHETFHADAIHENIVIVTKVDAEQIINTTLTLIEEVFS